MNEREFWKLIEMIEGDGKCDTTTDLTHLRDFLSQHRPTEIEAFFEILAQKLYAIDTRQHYRGFSWFKGLSDTFLYTRLAVVAQGEANYDKILANPKSFPGRSAKWLEGLLYVAGDAYRDATGKDFDRASTVCVESFSNSEGWAK